MAKKEINANSSPTEIRIANEQLAKAQQDYKAALAPYAGKSLSLVEQDRIAQSVTSKYDYVDFGPDPALAVPGEINIGGINTFYVKGLKGQSKTTFPPQTGTTVNPDDAFPVTKPTEQTTIPATPGVNPKQQKTDQNTQIESAPQTITQSPQVEQDTSGAGTSGTGLKDAAQAGAALEKNNKNQTNQNQNGIVNENPNDVPVTNNTPSRLNDGILNNPTIGVPTKGNVDDAASVSRPMGTAISGFVNVDEFNSSPDPARAGTNGSINIGTAENITIPQSKPGTKNKSGIEVKSNILHEFANWTYTIAWYMLPIDTYNALMRTGNIGDTGDLIAKSGGVGGKLNQAMAGDVYFRNLRFTSVIGNRQSGAATNNFELEMTVVEPYGASLIGELAAMALNSTGKDSISPAEVPYLIEIDFAGYKDDGTPVPSILGTKSKGKKYIPVKILNIEMKLESAGSVYTITMAPYSYFAQTARYADMEFSTKLTGKTVIEQLGSQGNGLMAQLKANEEKKVREGIAKQTDEYFIDLYSFNASGSRDQAMASSPFTYEQTGGQSTVPKNREPDNDPTKGVNNIAVGSIIKDAIKNVVLASEYYNQKVKPNVPHDKSNPAELIKVIPVIEILKDKFDPARNEFAKRITYKVFNTLNFGEVFAHVGNAPVSDWGYSKEYNWLFTGKNEDVIDVDLTFQFIYFAKMQTNVADHNKIHLASTAASKRTAGEQPVSRLQMAQRAGHTSNMAGNFPERYINSTIAAEWFDSKMMSNTGDNVAVNMRIIGDPDWIPQDASVRGGAITIEGNLYDRHGSIAVDVAGVYVKLKLRTPRDYNPRTGLMDLKTDKNVVEGVYQVITVESNFEDGRFTQTLNMVKVPNQDEEKPQNSSAGIFSSNNPADRQLRGG